MKQKIMYGLFMIYLTIICMLQSCTASVSKPEISLKETVRNSALFDLRKKPLVIKGSVNGLSIQKLHIRVTNDEGLSSQTSVLIKDGRFRCNYPNNFKGAKLIKPTSLYIDASDDASFNVYSESSHQAEACVLIYDGKTEMMPDIASGFTTDLYDAKGRSDKSGKDWKTVRSLMNLYMRSKAARIVKIGKKDFDLAKPGDFKFYKNNIALYDFDNRDRDWSTPLANRPARTFWKSVWNTWFNSSNDHPIDGNKNNNDPSNYTPYAFSNDFSDIFISYQMRRHGMKPFDDNLTSMCNEATRNLLAMQHKDPTNFALVDHRGKQEHYTAGAFRYGMFVNGEYLTEGNGWFYNPAFLDYIAGGVLNGRCLWAMGEALKADPHGPLANELKSAIALTIKFCLNDALQYGYAHKTSNGNVYWRVAGEHAYLVVGMVAACSVAPDMVVLNPEGKSPVTLKEACVSALNALVDLKQPHNQWAIYPNTDSMAIAALADGADVLRKHLDAKIWRKAASDVADAWMKAKVPASELPVPAVNFGLRIKPDEMTFNWSRIAPDGWKNRNFIFYYQTGHWMHALSRLYAVTGDARYLKRTEAMLSYLCGDNPFGVRLMNEIGGVYNWTEDSDGDGIEDYLKQDMYPESTAFCQIGTMHLMRAVVSKKVDR
ncbi:MAG: hypothetical protein ACYC0V_06540 [Armatimonadota bacterium]